MDACALAMIDGMDIRSCHLGAGGSARNICWRVVSGSGSRTRSLGSRRHSANAESLRLSSHLGRRLGLSPLDRAVAG